MANVPLLPSAALVLLERVSRKRSSAELTFGLSSKLPNCVVSLKLVLASPDQLVLPGVSTKPLSKPVEVVLPTHWFFMVRIWLSAPFCVALVLEGGVVALVSGFEMYSVLGNSVTPLTVRT